jgi:hypothetical protein
MLLRGLESRADRVTEIGVVETASQRFANIAKGFVVIAPTKGDGLDLEEVVGSWSAPDDGILPGAIFAGGIVQEEVLFVANHVETDAQVRTRSLSN